MPESALRLSTAETATRCFDPFRVLTPEARQAQMSIIQRRIQTRNGPLDFARLHLKDREERDRSATPSWRGPLGRHAFFEHFYGRRIRALDPQIAWLLAIARINEAESFGVEFDIGRILTGAAKPLSPTRQYMLLDERYHTRALLEICQYFGLNVVLKQPPWGVQQLIRAMSYLPEPLAHIPVLCGEALGCVLFRELTNLASLFESQSEIQARIRQLLDGIVIDETLHALYFRASLPPLALRAARSLAPLVVRSLLRDIPELETLGITAQSLIETIERGIPIPPELVDIDATRET